MKRLWHFTLTAMTGNMKDEDMLTQSQPSFFFFLANVRIIRGCSRAAGISRGCYSALLSDSMSACGSQVHTQAVFIVVKVRGLASSLRGRFLLGQFEAFDESLEDEADGDLVDVLDVLRVPITQGLGHCSQEWVLDVPEVFLLEALDLEV